MDILKLGLTTLPMILPFIFLVLLRWGAQKGMFVSSIIFIVLAYYIWGMDLSVIGASIIQGVHKALTILYILFGAIMLLKVLTYTKSVEIIKGGFRQISDDMRVQAVIVGVLFVALIEGAAGFGAPAVVAAPLLMSLGFTPLSSAVIALVGDSVPVSFGAVGTPVLVGLGDIKHSSGDFFHQIANHITMIDSVMGILLPTIVIVFLTLNFGKRKSIKDVFEILPWTLMIGIFYAVLAIIDSFLLGPEFVSLVTPILTLVLATVTAKKKFLLPKHTTWTLEGKFENSQMPKKDFTHSRKRLILAWMPYLLLVVLLIATRMIPPLKAFCLHAIDFGLTNILHEGFNSSWQVLYSPGSVLLVSAILAFFLERSKKEVLIKSFFDSIYTVKGAAIVLVFTLALVQTFVNSAHSGMDISMPSYLAHYLAEVFKQAWVFVAPFLGILGAFITGSATVSTLTFATIQSQVASGVGLDHFLILAEQVIGGAAGNMICIHNVVAVATVVGLINKEGDIIKKTLPMAIFYGLMAGLMSFILMHFFHHIG